MNFDNTPQLIAYSTAEGQGSLYLAVSEVDVTKNSTAIILGTITGATFIPLSIATDSTPEAVDPLVTTVPEPASVLLVGIGLIGLASRIRRRRP